VHGQLVHLKFFFTLGQVPEPLEIHSNDAAPCGPRYATHGPDKHNFVYIFVVVVGGACIN
jgi:hypothetical protein